MKRLLPVLVAVLLLAGLAPASAEDPALTNTVAPSISGTAQFDRTLTADPGTWDPAGATFTYRWLRSGTVLDGETAPTLTIDDVADLGQTFTVEVTAHQGDMASTPVVSAPTTKVLRATFTNTERPTIDATPRFRHTVKGGSGHWSRGGLERSYRWLRDDKPISGATHRTYEPTVSDVGHQLRLRITATRDGFRTVQARSKARTMQHMRAVRKTVTYSVTTRGHITSSVATFKKLAAETYADPRGWRAMGVKLTRVSHGGDFTLVLAQASTMTSFSSGCSTTYSCRVGRYVVINQSRWQHASPAWNAHGGSLRNYRNLVVNHETGHWFGKQHAQCGGKGQLAPVMQQQSKDLQGCKINAWPKVSELHAPRYGW